MGTQFGIYICIILIMYITLGYFMLPCYTWVTLGILVWSVFLIFFIFLCCIFVFFVFTLCIMPNFPCVSVLLILDFPFGFL